MATKTIQLGSGVAPIGSLFTFERITTDDIYEDNWTKI